MMSTENPQRIKIPKAEIPDTTDELDVAGMSEKEIEDHIAQYSDDPEENIRRLYVLLHKYSSLLSPETKRNICSIFYKRAQDKLQKLNERINIESDGNKKWNLKKDARSLENEIRDLAPHAGISDREIWKNRDPFVFRESNVEGLKELVKMWHEIRPDYILLTETSAVPYGYAIKEAWKTAYPNEEYPTFYRIESWTERSHVVEFVEPENDIDTMINNQDAHSPDLPVLNMMKIGITNYLKERIQKSDAKIIIFDQYNKPMKPRRLNGNNGGKTISGVARELHKSYPEAQLYYAGVGIFHDEVNFGRSGYPIDKKHPRVTLKRNVISKKKEHTLSSLRQAGNRIDPLANETGDSIRQEIFEKGYRPVGKMLKDPKRRKEALKYIHDLKEIGKIAGEELHTKLNEVVI